MEPVLVPRRRKAAATSRRTRKVNPKVMKLARDKIREWPAYKARSYLRGLAQVDPNSLTSRAVRRLAAELYE